MLAYRTPSPAALRVLRAVSPAQSALLAFSPTGEMGMLMENKALSAPLHLVGHVPLSLLLVIPDEGRDLLQEQDPEEVSQLPSLLPPLPSTRAVLHQGERFCKWC